jgi:hypothetical protein
MPRIQTIPEELTKLHHIVADETCQTKHRWMAIGSTVVSDEYADRTRAHFLAWKRRMGLKGEIKWTDTDRKNLDRYKTLARVYMALVDKGIIQFHSIVMDMEQVTYDDVAQVPEMAYNRFFHQLLLHRYLKLYPRESKYRVLFDRRTSKIAWRPFQDAANFAARREVGLDHWPVRSIEYRESKCDILLQLNDLMLGAIGYLCNDKHIADKHNRAPKTKLAYYIRSLNGSYAFYYGTPPSNKTFTVWRIAFGGKKLDYREDRAEQAASAKLRQTPKHKKGEGRSRKPRTRLGAPVTE